ncbi:hypothetical protein BDQ12DRAFT_679577 [Crucibulum laeve]|uniref:Uncharacterized protein n=1 Tax=Crucibulum laeve TaxID=68775 RepID=A0A5C3M772_9AGAR|nr:hypothetical protein BDQ12DRAFT_679577 [Crucibulum laeve]
MPSAVLLPLITAVDIKAKEEGLLSFDWPSVDFVTDRNGLRKLLRWIVGGEVKNFRIDLQLAGEKTVLFNRWERRTRELFSGYTFGFNFEKASTKHAYGCENSTGHHRIVTYDLSGLKMVVRFEVDACLPTEAPATKKSTPSLGASTGKSASNVDDLIDSLANVKISPTDSSSPSSIPSSATDSAVYLQVIKGGNQVPQSAIIELTTRSEARASQLDWAESFPQLFLSQTAHHFLAIHQRGRFIEIQKRKLTSPELQKVASDIQPYLKKLRRILDDIKALVIKHGERGRLSLVCIDGDLKVYERSVQDSCLPDEVLARFEG